jgi:hypothetical protein
VDFGRGYVVGIYLTELSLLRIDDETEPVGVSVEEQLRLAGKQWTRIAGEITVGAYVEDILEGRLDQPEGRGSIGQVVSLLSDGNGQWAAIVDFGRSYVVGIYLSELSLLRIETEPVDVSVEEQLRLAGKQWARIAGEITVGAYVEDILEGRLNQPEGRGSIGQVVSLLSDDNGQPAAMVDFGRGYVVGIYLAELSLLRIDDVIQQAE